MELRSPALPWQEYRLSQPQGFQQRALPGLARQGERGDAAVRQLRSPDGAGDRLPQRRNPPDAGVRCGAQASSYTLAETAWSQQLPDWLGSHARCFVFLGGILEIVVLDNLRSVVSKARRYEPDFNPSYRGLAGHDGVEVVPKVEVGVQVVACWILAALRSHQLFSLDELSTAIAVLLDRLDQRPFKSCRSPGNRLSKTWIVRPCARCQSSLTSRPSGRRPRCIATTTSRSTGITTRRLISW
ncbi:hypothetical protein D3C78_1003380 [compost metagenome]